MASYIERDPMPLSVRDDPPRYERHAHCRRKRLKRFVVKHRAVIIRGVLSVAIAALMYLVCPCIGVPLL